MDQGVATALEKSPQLIVSDLSIPDKTGFDFLNIRQQKEPLQKVPVIVLSGLDDRESVSRAISLGASDYLVKPIRAPLLLQKARKHLRTATFLTRSFSDQSAPKAIVSVPVDLLRINEVGFQIESAIKLRPEETVAVVADFFKEIGCQNLLTRTAQKPDPRFIKGRYLCEIKFVGVNEKTAQTIRKSLKRLP